MSRQTYEFIIYAIDCFHDPIMQHVLGGSLHKNNTSCLLLGLYHASVNLLSIVFMQIPPKMNCIMGSVKKANVETSESGQNDNFLS